MEISVILCITFFLSLVKYVRVSQDTYSIDVKNRLLKINCFLYYTTQISAYFFILILCEVILYKYLKCAPSFFTCFLLTEADKPIVFFPFCFYYIVHECRFTQLIVLFKPSHRHFCDTVL